jgi:hypothetical protein
MERLAISWSRFRREDLAGPGTKASQSHRKGFETHLIHAGVRGSASFLSQQEQHGLFIIPGLSERFDGTPLRFRSTP